MIKQLINLDNIIRQSHKNPIFIFKHSSSCPLSRAAKKTVDSFFENNPTIEIYQLTVQTERSLSNEIANRFQIKHESPQLLCFKNGRVVHVLNHGQIASKNIEKVHREFY